MIYNYLSVIEERTDYYMLAGTRIIALEGGLHWPQPRCR